MKLAEPSDVIFAGLLVILVGALVAAVLYGRDYLVEKGLMTQKVVIIPLVEITRCHDKGGKIVVKDGKWTCE